MILFRLQICVLAAKFLGGSDPRSAVAIRSTPCSDFAAGRNGPTGYIFLLAVCLIYFYLRFLPDPSLQM